MPETTEGDLVNTANDLERNSRTAMMLWMGNTFELKCHLEVDLCCIATHTSLFYFCVLVAANYCFIAVMMGSLKTPVFLRIQIRECNWNRINWESQAAGRCLMTMGNARHS